ncbi:HAD family hydrolase [Natrinema sp. 1APR25-10V2]|uniref:HAD family hydrolase n=1 Tax=Natrinema sp. 1APR25-10V2 TaxID=2951081 RepID=UPI0028752D7C|nr:HAD family hydrolase [Natrinema sp. 1APR25-10V2]MDS0473387.1 HAD family hydrolase [Natrinema sp. 1APR25-10V2]
MRTERTEAVEAITVDLDGTVLQYERSPGAVLEAAFERTGVGPLFSVDEYYARYDEFAAQSDSMDELRSDCFAALAAENGYARQHGRDVAAAFSGERDQSNVELLPGAARVLDELSREYRLAVVTNGARDAQRRKIDAVDLERWVNAVVVAGHDAPPKPDPEPFERAVRALDATPATPATTVHVGDSLETDVAGAAAAGLESVRLSDRAETGGYEPTYRIESIGELRDLPRLSDAGGYSESDTGTETQ